MHTKSQPYLQELYKCRVLPSVFFHNCLPNLQLGLGGRGVQIWTHSRFFILFTTSQHSINSSVSFTYMWHLEIPTMLRWGQIVICYRKTDIKTDLTDIGCNDKWWLELSLDCPGINGAEHMVSTVRWFSQKVNHNTHPLTKNLRNVTEFDYLKFYVGKKYHIQITLYEGLLPHL